MTVARRLQSVHTSRLPERVAGSYFPHWESERLRTLPASINTAFVAFAINSGSAGAVQWAGWNTLNAAEFKTDLQSARSYGRCVLLSIGGAGITFALDTSTEVTNFVNSIKSLYGDWGGFDGIDWDVEGQHTDETNYAAASRELKDFYGGDFAISMSYAGTSDEGGFDQPTYKAIAEYLESTGDLDLATIQYYDYPGPQTSDVSSRLSEMTGTWHIDPHHLGVGVKYEPGVSTSWTSTSALNSMWDTVHGTYPTLRGMINWESVIDRSNSSGFSGTVAPHVRIP